MKKGEEFKKRLQEIRRSLGPMIQDNQYSHSPDRLRDVHIARALVQTLELISEMVEENENAKDDAEPPLRPVSALESDFDLSQALTKRF